MPNKTALWHIYLLKCHDNTLYCGVTTDLTRRLHEHNHLSQGAKYTRVRRPVVLIYSEPHLNRSSACKREAAIKKLTKAQKLQLIAQKDETLPL